MPADSHPAGGWLGLAARLPSVLSERARAGMTGLRQRRAESSGAPPRGVAFTGTVWTGGQAQPRRATVVVDAAGRFVSMGASAATLPRDLLVLGGPHHWIVPGIIDAHVHLCVATEENPERRSGVESGFRTGLIGVRDLGAPLEQARSWQTGRRPPPPQHPFVAVSGPILTAPQGYPSRSWGARGFAEFISSPAQARSAVQRLAAEGVDVIKVALERGSQGWPVLQPNVLLAITRAAHALGLAVVAHALTIDMVKRALDAGVDELAHTPTDRLGEELVQRIADAGVSVTSTLQTFFSAGVGPIAAANAADLVSAGVVLRYGTDLGNAGTRPGVDPRELDRLAAAGLGRLGALRAATEWAALAPGMRSRSGLMRIGRPAELVLLPGDPLAEPGIWRTPAAIFVDGRLTVGSARPDDSSSSVDPRGEHQL
jgi:imidazolonepropionase-like amidohydrolase